MRTSEEQTALILEKVNHYKIARKRELKSRFIAAGVIAALFITTVSVPGLRTTAFGAVNRVVTMFNIKTGESERFEINIPNEMEALRDKYQKKTNNVISVEKEGRIVSAGPTARHYTDPADFINLIEQFGFPDISGLDFSNGFTGNVSHSWNSRPVDQWEEDGYLISEYEVNTEAIQTIIFSLSNITVIMNPTSEPSRISGESVEVISIPGWDQAFTIIDHEGSLRLNIFNPLSEDTDMTKFGYYEQSELLLVNPHFRVDITGGTLEEMIDIAMLIK